MTLEEFQQKLASVSDRRLLRILNRAEAEGLAPAIALIRAEKDRRAVAAAELQTSSEAASPKGQPSPLSISENKPIQVEKAPSIPPTENAFKPQSPMVANGLPKPFASSTSVKLEKDSPLSRQTKPQQSLLSEENQDLTSQIRPLEEVLGRHFNWDMGNKPPSDESGFNPEFIGERELENPVAQFGLHSRHSEPGDDAEEMAPLQGLREDWAPDAKSHEGVNENPSEALPAIDPMTEAQRKQRAWAVVAIILLFIAGFLAIWRALVA
jgi:hypothetical protein